MLPRVHVLVPVYDCFEYLTKCLATIKAQDYDDMRVVVIDDDSPDERQRAMVESVNRLDGWTGRVNAQRQFCPRNIWDAVQLADAGPDDVIAIVDGDDFLPDSGAISRLAAIYEDPEVWMTVGGYTSDPYDPGCHMPQPYPPEVIQRGTYRTHGLHEFNHIVSFLGHLWEASITEDDLKFPDGQWFTGAYDYALCSCLLERSGRHTRCVTDQTLYVYRSNNSESDALIHREEVLSASDVIRSRPPKLPIDEAHAAAIMGTSRPVRVRRPARR